MSGRHRSGGFGGHGNGRGRERGRGLYAPPILPSNPEGRQSQLTFSIHPIQSGQSLIFNFAPQANNHITAQAHNQNSQGKNSNASLGVRGERSKTPLDQRGKAERMDKPDPKVNPDM